MFSLAEAAEILKEVDSGNGRYINPGKIDGEIRLRLFGEGITGYEVWVTEDGKDKPMRWESKPSELPSNLKVYEGGRESQLKRFIAVIAWDYEAEEFKILSMNQKTLLSALMGLIADEDWGDPSGYDIKIRKEGVNKNSEYFLKPVPKKAVTKELKESYANLACDLSKMLDGEDPFGDTKG